MKHLHLSFLFLSLTLFSNAQERSLDSVIFKLFDAVNNRDEKAYLNLHPDRKHMLALLKFDLSEIKPMTHEEDSMLLEMFGLKTDEAYAEASKLLYLRSFGEAAEVLDRLKIKPGSLSFRSAVYERPAEGLEKNIMVSGVMDLAVGVKEYQLKFYNMYWSPIDSGWYGPEIVGIVPKGEKFPDVMRKSSSNGLGAPSPADADAPVSEAHPTKKTEANKQTEKKPPIKPSPASKPKVNRKTKQKT